MRVNLVQNFLVRLITMGIPWEMFESMPHIEVISLLNYTRQFDRIGESRETRKN